MPTTIKQIMSDERAVELKPYFELQAGPCGCTWLGSERFEQCEKHDPARALEVMERARAWARAALRPATLAAEFQVPIDEIVDAIATALLPYVEKYIEREKARR
jgi:hypothetical protein